MSGSAPDRALRVVRSRAEWDAELPAELAGDLYYRWEYLEIWAREEGAEPLGFGFDADGLRVLYPLLRQPLDALPGGAGRCDLRTPYDFGGPRVIAGDPVTALARFDAALLAWCSGNGVVSEFARLHPLALPAVPPDAELHAENFVVDLRLSADELSKAQHSSHRWAARAAARSGLAFVLDADPPRAAVDRWTALYRETMSRVGGGAAYDYSDRLFHDLVALEGVSLARVDHEGETVAAALFVLSGDALFYFLSAATAEARPLKATNFLLDRAIAAARERELRWLHLGGGAPSLRHFKGQVATGAVPYFVRRRVHDAVAYESLRGAAGAAATGGFPAYRQALLERARSG